MTHRPFRFGVGPGGLGRSAEQTTRSGWGQLVRRVEDLGYSALNVGDHLDGRLAPLPALAVAAALTTTLRLGCFLLCNDYRNPTMLAHELASVDALSGGRVEAGLGAGWLESDYRQAGIPFDPAGVRISRLAATVPDFRAALRTASVQYLGGGIRADGREFVPLVLGGGGRRMLGIAGEYADIVAYNVALTSPGRAVAPGASATRAAVAERVAWVAAAAGARSDRVENHIYLHAVEVDRDTDAAVPALASRLAMSPGDVRESPHVLVGPVEKMVDDLLARREQFGFSYVSIPVTAMETFAPVVARLTGR